MRPVGTLDSVPAVSTSNIILVSLLIIVISEIISKLKPVHKQEVQEVEETLSRHRAGKPSRRTTSWSDIVRRKRMLATEENTAQWLERKHVEIGQVMARPYQVKADRETAFRLQVHEMTAENALRSENQINAIILEAQKNVLACQEETQTQMGMNRCRHTHLMKDLEHRIKELEKKKRKENSLQVLSTQFENNNLCVSNDENSEWLQLDTNGKVNINATALDSRKNKNNGNCCGFLGTALKLPSFRNNLIGGQLLQGGGYNFHKADVECSTVSKQGVFFKNEEMEDKLTTVLKKGCNISTCTSSHHSFGLCVDHVRALQKSPMGCHIVRVLGCSTVSTCEK